MPLQQLVLHFNDQFERQHGLSHRPFSLRHGAVYGLYPPLQIGSVLTPIRQTVDTTKLLGHSAQLCLMPIGKQRLQGEALESLLGCTDIPQPENDLAIINFDRLARTVHMLNFLPISHLSGGLMVNVDARHILAVKKDHGAYFEEIINKCGLETKQVIIQVLINSAYSFYQRQLDEGLQNYRHCGYQLALRFDTPAVSKITSQLIATLAPNFVCCSARTLKTLTDKKRREKLQQLLNATTSISGHSILLNVDDQHMHALAKNMGFAWVQGGFYEQPAYSTAAQSY